MSDTSKIETLVAAAMQAHMGAIVAHTCVLQALIRKFGLTRAEVEAEYGAFSSDRAAVERVAGPKLDELFTFSATH